MRRSVVICLCLCGCVLLAACSDAGVIEVVPVTDALDAVLDASRGDGWHLELEPGDSGQDLGHEEFRTPDGVAPVDADLDARTDGAGPVDAWQDHHQADEDHVMSACPTPIVACDEGAQVVPLTRLHLDGSHSIGVDGAGISGWKWQVGQPFGSHSVLDPSDNEALETFRVVGTGDYTFSLTVVDDLGHVSCGPGYHVVTVLPTDALFVELSWESVLPPEPIPGRPLAFPDLDLHFAHPLATGLDVDLDGKPDPWFAVPYDCYELNSHPNWVSYDPAALDDPILQPESGGPESVSMQMPQDVAYRIGVHYANAMQQGDVKCLVRIYVNGELVLNLSGVQLSEGDLWEVGYVTWPSGEVVVSTLDGEAYKITPHYGQ